MAVQWLRLRASNAGGPGSIPVWETKIPHAVWPKEKMKVPSGSKHSSKIGKVGTISKK